PFLLGARPDHLRALRTQAVRLSSTSDRRKDHLVGEDEHKSPRGTNPRERRTGDSFTDEESGAANDERPARFDHQPHGAFHRSGHRGARCSCRSSRTRLAAIGPSPRNQVSSGTSMALPFLTAVKEDHCTESITSFIFSSVASP